MPTEATHLFHPDALRPGLSKFVPPPTAVEARPKLERWAKQLASGSLDKKKETELLPGFVTDVFEAALGYTRPPADPYTLKREALVQVDGKFADAGFGRFGTAGETFVAVLEGKGPRDPLDRPFAGRKLSAVEQAVKRLMDEHAKSVLPLQALAREAGRHERRVSDVVNAAFGLTPDEVKLMWDTAPPRMPTGR